MSASAAASLALLLGALAGCAPAGNPAADSAQFVVATGEVRADRVKWTVSPRGVGAVYIGMPLDSLSAVLGHSARSAGGGRACAYLRPEGLPRGVALLVVRDTVVRVDVATPEVLTEEGVGVGDSEVGLLVLHAGSVRVEAHGASAHTLLVSHPADSPYVLVFETDGSMVLRYRAGRRAVTLAEDYCA